MNSIIKLFSQFFTLQFYPLYFDCKYLYTIMLISYILQIVWCLGIHWAWRKALSVEQYPNYEPILIPHSVITSNTWLSPPREAAL